MIKWNKNRCFIFKKNHSWKLSRVGIWYQHLSAPFVSKVAIVVHIAVAYVFQNIRLSASAGYFLLCKTSDNNGVLSVSDILLFSPSHCFHFYVWNIIWIVKNFYIVAFARILQFLNDHLMKPRLKDEVLILSYLIPSRKIWRKISKVLILDRLCP